MIYYCSNLLIAIEPIDVIFPFLLFAKNICKRGLNRVVNLIPNLKTSPSPLSTLSFTRCWTLWKWNLTLPSSSTLSRCCCSTDVNTTISCATDIQYQRWRIYFFSFKETWWDYEETLKCGILMHRIKCSPLPTLHPRQPLRPRASVCDQSNKDIVGMI